MSVQTPERSLDQRLNALGNANSIRTFRSDLKKDMKAGKITLYKLLSEPPEEIQTMKVINLLLAAPRVGQVKANKILARCRISASKTVGGLSTRQRDELITLLCRR